MRCPPLGNRNYKNECVRRGRQETCMSEINEGAVRQYGWSAGGAARLLFVVGVTFSAFQIVTASFSPLSSSIVRAVHVGFCCSWPSGSSAVPSTGR